MKQSTCTCGHTHDEHDGPHRIRPCGKCECMYFERRIISTETYDKILAVLAIVAICLAIAGLGFAIGAIPRGTL